MSTSTRQDLVAQVLISIGLALVVIIGFTWIRLSDAADANTSEQQSSHLTHDINVIQNYRGPYVGNNSNTVQALYALPLGARIDRVEIHDTGVVVILTNGDTTSERENALYSSVAFMAAIDNASSVTYLTPNGSYMVERAGLEERFGSPLSTLLDSPEAWQGVRTLVPLEADSLVIGG